MLREQLEWKGFLITCIALSLFAGSKAENAPLAVLFFTLSDVYFNQKGTLALTGISSFCGGLCGLFQWKVFQRRGDGTWEESDWHACRPLGSEEAVTSFHPYGRAFLVPH
jgi:hypothetical protein